MGNGFSISDRNLKIQTKLIGNVVLENMHGVWCYTSNVPAKEKNGHKIFKLPASEYKEIVN